LFTVIKFNEYVDIYISRYVMYTSTSNIYNNSYYNIFNFDVVHVYIRIDNTIVISFVIDR